MVEERPEDGEGEVHEEDGEQELDVVHEVAVVLLAGVVHPVLAALGGGELALQGVLRKKLREQGFNLASSCGIWS